MIQIHLRVKVKSNTNKNIEVYLAVFPYFMPNLMLELRHFVKLLTP